MSNLQSSPLTASSNTPDPKTAREWAEAATAAPKRGSDAPPGRVLRVFGESFTLRKPMPPTGTWIIGRGHEADVQISDPSISRRHARLHITENGVHIEDLGSSNGTRVRDQALS